jgi:hypothetical protein
MWRSRHDARLRHGCDVLDERRYGEQPTVLELVEVPEGEAAAVAGPLGIGPTSDELHGPHGPLPASGMRPGSGTVQIVAAPSSAAYGPCSAAARTPSSAATSKISSTPD